MVNNWKGKKETLSTDGGNQKKDRTLQVIDFDKIRYPGYKELVYRKKN
jgi:hypothetical protein